jgi:hypothetical protein
MARGILGVSMATVTSRLYTAKLFLSKFLKERVCSNDPQGLKKLKHDNEQTVATNDSGTLNSHTKHSENGGCMSSRS